MEVVDLGREAPITAMRERPFPLSWSIEFAANSRLILSMRSFGLSIRWM